MPDRVVDLHTHSLASDGTDSPAALVRKAAAKGLAAIALTDHDSMDGLDEAAAEAVRSGIAFVRGIELAVQDGPAELHILGLFMPQPSERMRAALEILRQSRRVRNQAMLDMLAALGMPMSMAEVRAHSGKGAVGRPHIALAMKSRGYVPSRKDAFARYIGWKGAAFVPRTLFSPAEGIRLLRDEGATVVLAHPCLSANMTASRLDGILAKFRGYGLQALEAYHSAHDPEAVRLCVELARKHSLLLTGGSDYHGANKEGVELGSGAGRLRVPYALLEKLREFRGRDAPKAL